MKAARQAGDRLLEELEPLGGEGRSALGQPGDHAARPGQAGHEPALDRHLRGAGHDDRDGLGGPPRRRDGDRVVHDEDRGAEPRQLGRQLRVPLRPAFGEAGLEHNIAPLGVAQVAHAAPECLELGGAGGGRLVGQDPDKGDLRRPPGERGLPAAGQ